MLTGSSVGGKLMASWGKPRPEAILDKEQVNSNCLTSLKKESGGYAIGVNVTFGD